LISSQSSEARTDNKLAIASLGDHRSGPGLRIREGGTETIVEPMVSVTVGVEKNGKEKKLSLQKN
jgi:hypothetical protein